MADVEHTGEVPRAFDITKAGPLTLQNRGISFAVDGSGAVLRHSDGTPIDGQQIEDMVNRSGRRLTNAGAAGRLIAAQEFTDGVQVRVDKLRVADPATYETTNPSLK